MAKSIQEQLLKAGAIKPKQAKKVQQEKAREKKQARREGRVPDDAGDLQREIATAQATKRERDRELNAEQQARRKAREQARAVAQIISRNRIAPDLQGETVDYSYNLDNRIRRIEVGQAQRQELAAGRLAIVRYDAQASLLPRAVAQRLMEKIPECIWLVTDGQDKVDENDPYAEYQVPDDLMW